MQRNALVASLGYMGDSSAGMQDDEKDEATDG